MDNVKTDYPDLTPTNGKKMRPLTSTLSFFIINDNGHLAVVAIQTDSKPSKYSQQRAREVLDLEDDCHCICHLK